MNVFEDLVEELKEQNLLEETVIDLNGVGPGQIGNGMSGFSRSNGNGPDPVAKRQDKPVFRPTAKSENVQQDVADLISAYQMVEHIFGSVERDHMKIVPNSFDDLAVKKSYHRLARASADPDSDQYFEAESSVLHDLESWWQALSARNLNIAPAHLRRFIETTQPPLSPQALFSLLRFYSISEFSEDVRCKFDLVVTRLFSKFVDGDRREMLCSRSEAVQHLNQRFSAWNASASSFSQESEPDAMLLVLTLEDLIVEAEAADDLGTLAESGYFDRMCRFKESIGAAFMTPNVAAAVIESNIRISNKLISLVNSGPRSIEELMSAFPWLDDASLSAAVGRTITLTSCLDEEPATETAEDERPNTIDLQVPDSSAEKEQKRSREAKARKRRSEGRPSLLGINRWLLLSTVLIVIASVGVYVWAEYFAGEPISTSGVKVVELDDPFFKENIRTAKLSGDMLYAVVTPGFNDLPKEEKEILLRKLREVGVQKGYNRVSLMSPQGRNIGYASRDRVEINTE